MRRIVNGVASILVLVILFPRVAFAGTIFLQTEKKIDVETKDDRIYIKGTLAISNSGDEASSETYPSLTLGAWEWTGEPKTLEAGGKFTWNLDTSFDKKKLSCRGEEGCADNRLPDIGIIPLYIKLLYSDLNKYKFSSIDVDLVSIGALTDEQRSSLRLHRPVPTVAMEGDGRHFEATVDLFNPESHEVPVVLSLYMPSEVKAEPSAYQLVLPPGKSLRKFFSLTNINALPKSHYKVVVVTQWEDSGARGAITVDSGVVIELPKQKGMLYAASAAIVLVILFLSLRLVKAVRKIRS